MGLFYKRPYGHFTCWWKRYTVFAAFTLLLLSNSSAQTALTPGQVAIVGFNTSGGPATDNFAFILLTDVEAGTIIYFTDCGVLSTQCLRFTEGIVSWTAPAGGCLAGTMVSMYTDANIIEGPGTAAIVSGTFSLNVSGDQLIVFQHADAGDLASAPICPDQFLFALTNNDEWQAEATDSHTSTLPDQLNIIPAVSVALPVDGGVFLNNSSFDCSTTSGSAEEILAALVDPFNWGGNESVVVPLPDCDFVISGFVVKYVTYDQIRLEWAAVDAGILLVVVYHTAPITDTSTGDGSSYVVGGNFESTGKVAFKGTSTDPVFVEITNLVEGQLYYFMAFTYITSTTTWSDGVPSTPETATAYVQEPTDPTATLQATTNATIDFAWTNYVGTPQADWWDGGVAIIAKAGSAVTMDSTAMNALDKSTTDLAVGQVLSDGNFVAAIVTGGGTTASYSNFSICTSYHFRIFHNDGDVDDDNMWSDGVAFGPVTTLCPEIAVTGNSVEIANGDATPSATDHTQFGEVLTTSTLDRTFTIKNTGTGTISLSGTPIVSISGDAEFTVNTQPGSTSLGALAETTFVVRFAPTGACDGTTYNATISIANSDTDENPYTFSVQGSCVAGCFTMVPLSGTPGTSVIITGAGFDGSTTASFGGTAATVTLNSATQIAVIVPIGVSGLVNVTTSSAITPDGCDQFNVIASPGTCPH